MKLFIASDIHGSKKYCELMLAAYDRERADKMLLLGDILYHGPRNGLPEDHDPKAVIAMLNPRKNEILCVRGNCDAEVDQMVLDFPVLADYCVINMGKLNIYATHGHVYNENNLPPLSDGDVLMCGHTHVVANRKHETYTYMNPGSVTFPKPDENGEKKRGYIICEDGEFTWKPLEG